MRFLDIEPPRGWRASAVKLLAMVTAAGMFLVLVMGATVTNTGSAQGCGRSWPLCNGAFIPEFTVATAIEFSHRAVTGLESFLILGLSAVALFYWRQHREIQVLVPVMVGTLVLQAGLGAWAVLYPQTAAILATHFGVSLIAFASTFLTAAFILEVGQTDGLRNRNPPPGYRRAVGLATLYVLGVVYLGAYVRQSGNSLGCVDWPLCNGAVFPGFQGPQGVAFIHRLAALGGVFLLGWLARWSNGLRDGRPDLAFGSIAAFALIVVQSLSGAAVVWTGLSLFTTLAHAGIMALLFATITYLGLHTLPTTEVGELAASRAHAAGIA